MHNALFFAIGFLIGALFGIVFMCLLQITGKYPLRAIQNLMLGRICLLIAEKNVFYGWL